MIPIRFNGIENSSRWGESREKWGIKRERLAGGSKKLAESSRAPAILSSRRPTKTARDFQRQPSNGRCSFVRIGTAKDGDLASTDDLVEMLFHSVAGRHGVFFEPRPFDKLPFSD